MMRLAVALVALALVAPGGAAAQDDLPEPVRLLLGEWEGEGELMGRPARFTMKWSHVLGDRFIKLEFSNAFVVDGVAQTVLMAEAFYRVEDATTLTGNWFDTRGYVLPLRASIVDGALMTEWGDASTEQGRTHYAPTPDGVEVIDYVATDSGEREFGRAVYRRR